MIASELVAAIFIADFPKYEKVVIADVLLSQYGPRKTRSASVDHVRLAGMIGVDPRMIRRAVNSLVKRGVLLDLPDGTYSFVKDWEAWSDPKDRRHTRDPLADLIGAGERRFIAYSVARYSAPNPSTRKRKTGTKECLPTTVDDTIESPISDYPGTNECRNNRNLGTAWSPPNADASSAVPGESLDLRISSSQTPRPPDPPLLSTEEIQEESVLSTEHKDRVCVRGKTGHEELDELRDTVAKLTEDDNLADVFRDQLGDWMISGMTPADVRQAIMLARSKMVAPRSYVAFVSGAARNIRNDRLTAERQARSVPTEAGPPAQAGSTRPSYAQRIADDRQRLLASFD